MKRNFTMIAAVAVLFAFLAIPMGMMGQEESTSTLIFTAKCDGSGTADDEAVWTVTSDGTESTFDNTKGIHYGTGSAQVKYIQLSTSDISGDITKVVVNASTASGVTATVDVTVGGSAFGGNPQSLTSSAANYTFEGSASGEIVVLITKPSKATKALYCKSIVVTYIAGSGSSAVATEVTIDATGITNTNLFNGEAAGTLIASVTEAETGEAISGASVTWSSSNGAVATIGENTGVVTLVAAGTTTITASYAGVEDEYQPSSAEYELTVIYNDPSVPTPTYSWVLTNLADLTEDDVFVIVGNNGSNYAMSNNNGTGSAPAAVSVTVANDEITSTVAANIQWTISGNATNGYTFYPNGSTTTWLYCTNTNNGVRVGTGEAKHFNLDEDYNYLTITETDDQRYIGIYNAQDWRCYKLGTNGDFPSNIAGQTFAFYKRVATYTLTIAAYGEGKTGYHLIASPVQENITPTAANGFLTSYYDLYYFDDSENDIEWRNFEVTPFDIVSGKGYLYASSTQTDLTFTGTPYNGNGEVTLYKTAGSNWSGWNLVGNPFAFTTYPSKDDFYVLSENGDEVVPSEVDGVGAMQGIFVIADENEETMTFGLTAPAKSAPSVSVNVACNRGNVIDRAVVRFDESKGLEKFQLNPDHTKVYFSQNNKDYAVVRAENQGEMPVNFKAEKNGSYTFSVNTENVDMNYLHLIDNMTGADVNLLQTPNYTFDARTTDYASRFRLVFSTTGVSENEESSVANFAYFNGNEWVVANEGNATLQVMDMTGRVVSTQTLNGNATVELNSAAGVYMFRLVNGNDVKVQKVVIK